MNKANRIGFLIRNIPQSSLRRLASFSSSSAANPRSPNFSTDEDEVEEPGSAVYRHALRHQRPTTIRWQPHLENSVSLIGSVDWPVEIFKTKKADCFWAFTFINVRNSRVSNGNFRIRVDMWNDMAKMGIQHLKQNDTIYVSGHLGSYKEADENGNLRLFYKIIVKELSYVAQLHQGSTFQKSDKSQTKAFEKPVESQSNARERSEESESGEGEIGVENCTKWQMFFFKPYEWWDKRKCKQNSSSPDFKHKFTGEKLWLRPDDPPWVKRQLQLLDMEIATQRKAQRVGETGMEKKKNNYHLWQVYFNSPHEWWDNRENKKNSRAPDFKHKDTGEALWMRNDDPPWIKRQLQFLDSLAEQSQGETTGSRSQISQWILDD